MPTHNCRSTDKRIDMALASAQAAPLRPEIKLSQALSDYEAILTAEQMLSYREARSPPQPHAVMALTCEIDRQNARRKSRRCGARLTRFLNSVQGFTSVVDPLIGSTGSPIAGTIWGAVKFTIQVSSSSLYLGSRLTCAPPFLPDYLALPLFSPSISSAIHPQSTVVYAYKKNSYVIGVAKPYKVRQTHALKSVDNMENCNAIFRNHVV